MKSSMKRYYLFVLLVAVLAFLPTLISHVAEAVTTRGVSNKADFAVVFSGDVNGHIRPCG